MARTPKRQDGATGPAKPDRRTAQKANGDVISSDSVARRAYEIYVARGGHHGADMDDWLEAERQLKRDGEQKSKRRLMP